MSGKKGKNRDRYVPTRESARRQLEKGKAREALKEAKVCFRTEASAANRDLLEEAYLVRIQQLHRAQQPADARAVLADLLAFGPKSPAVLESLTRLRVLLGDMSAATSTAFDADPSLLIEIADGAVLFQNSVVPNYADLPQHVNAVREALAAVEAGEDNRAIEHLVVISRGSPLADWRLFIRGLSAFYARDDERAEANWSRLEQSRPAARIARTLRLAANMPGGAEESPDIHVADGARRVTLDSESGPLTMLLTQLAVEWKQQNRKPFFRTYRQLQQKFARSHAAIVRQIVDVVWKSAVRNASEGVLEDLMAIGPPPELDPRWNRSRALQAQHPDYPSDLDDIESLWAAYVEDLQQLECLSETERKMAVGLVYQQIAGICRHEAEMLEEDSDSDNYGDSFDADDDVDDDVDELVRKAIGYYRQSIQACSQLEGSSLNLVKLYELNDQIESAAEVMTDLAKSHPDNFDAASWMASYHLSKDEPSQASAYVSTAQRLRPRDPRIAPLIWNQKLTMARGLVLNRKFDAARQEINDADGLKPADNDPCALDLFRAGIELKAGNQQVARQHLDAALAKIEEPAFVWMQMSSLAGVFRLAREVRKEFDDRLSEEIKKKVTSDTAGRIARFLARMKTTHTAYVGRAGHERLFIKYLKRKETLSWQPDDLKSVCEFLSCFPAQKRFRSKLVELGFARYSTVPHFAFWAGMEELRRDRTEQGELQVVEMLSSALRSHETGSAKLTDLELETAMSTLSTVRELIEERNRFDRFTRFSSDDDEDDEDDEFFDDGSEEVDSDDDGQPGFRMPLGMRGLSSLNSDEGGSVDFDISDEMLGSMERSMPSEMLRDVREVAKHLGLTVREVLRKMFLDLANGMSTGDEGQSRPSRKLSNPARRSGRRPSS